MSANLFKTIFDRTKAILAKVLSVGASKVSEPESPSAFNRISSTIKDRLKESQFKRRVLETKWYLKSRIWFTGQSVAEQYELHKWQWENCPMRQKWYWKLKLMSIPEVDEEEPEEDEEEFEYTEEFLDTTYDSTAKKVRKDRGRAYNFRKRFLILKVLFSCKTHFRRTSSVSQSNHSMDDQNQEATPDITGSMAEGGHSTVRVTKARRARNRLRSLLKGFDRLPVQIMNALWV